MLFLPTQTAFWWVIVKPCCSFCEAAKLTRTHTRTHIHARVPAGSSHPLDTHQRNKVQLLCLNSPRVFSQRWDNRAAHIRTVHRLVHTHVCTIRFFHGGADPASTSDSPSTWRHVFFVVYAFISLLSWTLWTRCPPPPTPSRSSRQYCRPTPQLPPANEGGQIRPVFNKGHERKQKQAE